MTYEEAIQYLYSQMPLFQNVGQGAYKEGLSNTIALDNHFGNPHRKYKTIHIAGTNGKGSCSHLLASILQESGYRVGLYTSPHLLDFRERIKVNGEMISEKKVIDFVEQGRSFLEPLHPSFFEVVTALAFRHFAEEQVDVAVIEVGLGGRLDCTNIITPVVSVITNISYDHVNLLGDTLSKIAGEKAGIMKRGVPVVIGEYTKETYPVFQKQSEETGSPIVYAEEHKQIKYSKAAPNGGIQFFTKDYGTLLCELGGIYQKKNANTVLNVIPYLKNTFGRITQSTLSSGFSKVKENTGLMGRWQKIQEKPLVVCDTGHNKGGFKYIVKQLQSQRCRELRIVIGMVNDKDINGVLSMLPPQATYYFCQASVARALPHDEIKKLAEKHHLHGDSYPSVAEAYKQALKDSSDTDFIYVGGSTFVVADFLSYLSKS